MATDAEYDAVLADKELFERRWNDSEAENAKLRADLEKLSKGLYDRCAQGSPFIQTNSVDTALAIIDRVNLQNERMRNALEKIHLMTNYAPAVMQACVGLGCQEKANQTYTEKRAEPVPKKPTCGADFCALPEHNT